MRLVAGRDLSTETGAFILKVYVCPFSPQTSNEVSHLASKHPPHLCTHTFLLSNVR